MEFFFELLVPGTVNGMGKWEAVWGFRGYDSYAASEMRNALV